MMHHQGVGYGSVVGLPSSQQSTLQRQHQQQQQQQREQSQLQQSQQQLPIIEKCPYEAYASQIPDCCAAAAAAAVAGQEAFPRPPSGYDTRCYDDCHRGTPYPDDSFSQDVGMGGVGVPYQRPPSRLGYDDCSQQQQQQQQQPQGTPSSQQPRPQSRVGFVTDSRCTSRLGGLGYDDTGGGGLGGSDPRMYCTSGYCMGDTIMARGLCGEELELDMRRHIQACACTCNHMGYGNYMDYQVSGMEFWDLCCL
ncbi:hypothetical protein TKK_0004152 [Trichogramma kaykai]